MLRSVRVHPVAAALLLVALLASAGGALAAAHATRAPAKHRKALNAKRARRGRRAKKTATGKPGGAPTVTSLRTQDGRGNGHLDSIIVKLSATPSGRGLASAFTVAGYRVLSVHPHGNTVDLSLAPHSSYDTGARPAVTVAGLTGLGGARAPRMTMTPADGAPPVLLSASTADLSGSGKLDAIDLMFSEPVSVDVGAVSVQGYPVQGTRDYPEGLLTVLLGPGGQANTGALPQVTLNGAGLRDAGGNRARSGPVNVTDGAAPVMVGARDEGFWLSGERIETVWSGPVHVVGSANPAAFTMHTAQGGAVPGVSLSGGDAPNEIAVNLPLAAETPTQIAYSGGNSVVDDAGHSGTASRWAVTVNQSPPRFAGTLNNPIDANQMMAFGQRSFYLQPWRSYMDTFPATRMLNAAGINFNVNSSNSDDVGQGARLLHDAGFTHARIDVPWNAFDYNNPGQLTPSSLSRFTGLLQQLKANGIRPLFLLQSNDGIPCPVQAVTLNLAAPAPAGATTVQLDSASTALVQPGLTGFYQYGREGGVLISSVDASNVATLSQPLNSAIPAGSQTAYDLKFQPFFPPLNPDGTANANNQGTLAGWLQYVGGVTQTAKQILGNDNFDVEVWNELGFGSDFLGASNYYSPAPQGSGDVTQELLQNTVAYIRNPVNGLSEVGIGDGFSNQEPWTSGANEVAGVTAIDKHPYHSATQFPDSGMYNGDTPLDALGQLDGTQVGGAWHDSFVPSFTAQLPEWFLTGIQTETVTRDLAPFTTDVYGTPHGRFTHPVGAAAPQLWVTEVNADASSVNDTLTSAGGTANSPMSGADVRHFETKAILRYLSAWIGKGTAVLDFFAAANAGQLNLIEPSFFTAAEQTHSYPGLAAGGETMVALQRFLQTMGGAQNLSQVRPLSLDSVSDYDGGYQFAGNGSAPYPPLYNRNVLGFFPFQVTSHSWVVPTYVMTQDLATLYKPSAAASDVTRQDMPPQVFRLTIGGVDAGTVRASATDPLTGNSVPVKVTTRGAGTVSLELPLTDSPRMLTLTDG